MMMKKFALAISFSLLAIASCAPNTQAPNDPTSNTTETEKVTKSDSLSVTIPASEISVSFPKNWFANPDENPFDLQYFSKNQQMNTGIFVYYTSDFTDEVTAVDLLEFQIEDLRSKRENFTVVEPEFTETINNLQITSTVFSGEKDSSVFNYKISVIEFTDNPEIILATLQIAFPSQWQKSKPILEDITRSFTLASAANEADSPTENPEN